MIQTEGRIRQQHRGREGEKRQNGKRGKETQDEMHTFRMTSLFFVVDPYGFNIRCRRTAYTATAMATASATAASVPALARISF